MAMSDFFGDEGLAMPLGLALMRMGGRSDRPRNLGVELGTALQQQQAIKQAKQEALLKQMQMERYKRAIAKEDKNEGLAEKLALLPQQFMKPAVPGQPERTQFQEPLMTQGMGGEVPQLPELLGRGEQIPPEMLGQATPDMMGTRTPMAGLLQNMPPQPAPNLATQTIPATPGQPASMDYEGLMQAQLPILEKLKPGTSFEYAAQMQKTKDDRQFKAAELKQKYLDRVEEIKLRAEEGRITREEADKRMIEARREMAQLAASLKQQGGATPYFQFFGTPEGVARGNARTGEVSLAYDANGKPIVKSADSPKLQGDLKAAKEEGKAMGEARGSLTAAKASLPQLEKTVGQLKDLADKATYTLVGQGRDAVARQFNTTTDGAVAREKYINTVRDVLFPQLRATFGAQFTVKEGEALVQTMGDPNKSPRERVAALEAFIDQKKQHIQSLERQTGQPTSDAPPPGAVKRIR